MKKITLLIFILIGLSLALFCQTQPEVPIGSGTETDPYLIANLANLRWLSENSEEWWVDLDTQVHFLQTADIDAYETSTWNNGSGFRPIGFHTVAGSLDFYRFTGIYDGNNFNIYDLYIYQENNFRFVGLFSQAYGSIIKNLNLIYIDIIVTDMNNISYVGGLSGTAGGVIQNCSTSGNIIHNTRTYHYTGGIAGIMGGSIENSFSSVNITGSSNEWGSTAGGLVGETSHSTIMYSYFTGSVQINGNRETIAGGIVGNAADSVVIESCYSDGLISANTTLSYAYSGGIVGCLDYDSIIYNSFSMGSVISLGGNQSCAGGISGSAGSGFTQEMISRVIIDKCFSTANIIGHFSGGLVGTLEYSYILNSFWNLESVYGFDPYGAIVGGYAINTTGLYTFEMKEIEPYVNNGWDFIYTWSLDPAINNGFPHLNMIESPFKKIDLSSVSVVDNSIILAWEVPVGPQPNNYTIYRNGVLLEEGLTEQVYFDTNAQNNTRYSYLIYGFFSDHNGISVTSNEMLQTARFPPQNLTYSFEDINVVLNWDPPHGGGYVEGYSVFRDGIHLTPYGISELSFTDTDTQPNTHYIYQVRARYSVWVDIVFSSPIEVELTTPEVINENDNTETLLKTELKGNYPNPFNPSTNISFTLSAEVDLRIDIYNIKGQKILALVDDIYPAGSHSVVWNGTDDRGYSVSSGIYFYKMTAGGVQEIRRMVMMK